MINNFNFCLQSEICDSKCIFNPVNHESSKSFRSILHYSISTIGWKLPDLSMDAEFLKRRLVENPNPPCMDGLSFISCLPHLVSAFVATYASIVWIMSSLFVKRAVFHHVYSVRIYSFTYTL